MQDSYQICSQNDVERQGGLQDAFITVCGPFLPFVRLRRVGVGFEEWSGWFEA